MNIHTRRQTCLAIVALIALGGCGAGTEKLTEVYGQVTLDGQALPSGTVITVPEVGTRGARSEIDGQGRFALESGDLGLGAVPGLHKVGISAYAATDPSNPEAPSKLLVPEKYTNPYSSGLTIDVKPGELNDVTLALLTKPR